MNVLSNRWIQKRVPHWERLTSLVATADQTRLRGLSRSELQELALLYRQVASDLSTLRQDRTSAALAGQVNHLLARAHHIIYSSRKSTWRNFFRFLLDEYPRVFRHEIGYVFAALVLVLAGGLIGVGFTMANPAFANSIVGPQVLSNIERHKMWTDSIVGMAPQAASGIMTNNLTVSFVAFAGGITFGLLTLWSMFFNGLLLGVIAVLCQKAGMSVSLWSFVAPHGSLELPAIIIAGAAGFRLAQGMLFPGIYRWTDSVARSGAAAVRLVSGTIPMLFVAGCFEGFFSPTTAPVALKFSVGAVLFTLMLIWLFRPLPRRQIEAI
jgi:uncharacterized membrane protein SpoIIM required for sporulation